MCTIIEYKEKYKDDLAKFLVGAETLVKESDFNITSEMKLFVGVNKKVKNNYRMYIALNTDKKIIGAISISNEGKLALLATCSDKVDYTINLLIKKAEDSFKTCKSKTFSVNTNQRYILNFTNNGYKAIRFLGSENDNKFHLEKTIINSK